VIVGLKSGKILGDLTRVIPKMNIGWILVVC